jgi:ribosomal protein S19E (S16A)
MPPRHNPLKLNPLQLRTLTLLQALARDPAAARGGPGAGEVTVDRFPQAHGGHFHVGNAAVSAKDASGLYIDKVWHALERKGLARADWPHNITLTAEGLAYETGLAHEILGPSPH